MIYTRNYDTPRIKKKEILRYAGVKGDAPELEQILEECVGELEGKLTYRVCYKEFDIAFRGELLDLGFLVTNSLSLRKNLEGCNSIVLFAATVGIGIDRLIARYTNTSPLKAFMFQAIGAERIESLCDVFCTDLEKDKGKLRPRFSAGYGDLPLETQKSVFAALDCQRRIGLTLNNSLLMSPSKSVTAIVGIPK